MKNSRIGIIAVTVLCGAILLISGTRAISYLSTDFVNSGVSQTDEETILTALRDRWNLVVVNGATDLPDIIANERIARIEFRRSVIQHAEEEPQQGLVIRVWSSNLVGRIERRSFMLLWGGDGQPRISALTTT